MRVPRRVLPLLVLAASLQALPEPAFGAGRGLAGLGSCVGLLRRRAEDFWGALGAFRAGRGSDPEIQQLARFCSGVGLAVLGLPRRAAAEVGQALRLAPGS